MSLKQVRTLLSGPNNQGGDYSTREWKSFSGRVRSQQQNTCQCCRIGGRRTEVHHLFYDSNRRLWDYEIGEVILLCESCHREFHEELKKFRQHIFGKLTPQAFRILNGALSVAVTQFDPLTFAHAMAEFVSTPSLVRRYAEAWERDEKGKPLQEMMTLNEQPQKTT